jgi:hypothetical protein
MVELDGEDAPAAEAAPAPAPAPAAPAAPVCEKSIDYNGPEVCKLFSMNFEKYLRILVPFYGAIYFSVGVILAFFGARFLFQLVAICFALFVTAILFGMSYNIFLPHDKVPVIISFLFLCSLVAGYISYQCYSFAKTWAVSLISAWGGLALGLIAIKFLFI